MRGDSPPDQCRIANTTQRATTGRMNEAADFQWLTQGMHIYDRNVYVSCINPALRYVLLFIRHKPLLVVPPFGFSSPHPLSLVSERASNMNWCFIVQIRRERLNHSRQRC